MGGMKRSSHILARAQLINLNRKKEHHNQLAAMLSDSPIMQQGESILTNAVGLALWSVRTVDCYSRFDAAEPRKKTLMDTSKRGGGRKKRLIIFPFTVLDFLPWVIND